MVSEKDEVQKTLGYRLGKDGKIKGIENLDGMPDYIIYKTDKPIALIGMKGMVKKIIVDKPEDFEGW